MEKLKTDLVVLGAGPGGYAAAFRAADLGKKVILIDDEPHLGGVCLNRGCIPSKALLHISEVISESRKISHVGVEFSQPKIDLTQIRKWKNQVIRQLTGGLKLLSDQRNIQFIQGLGTFLDDHSLRVINKKGEEIQIHFDQIIIATGSRPTRVEHWNFDSDHYWTSTDALKLSVIPEKLLIVGAGYIGLEMAMVYHSLGSEVTILEKQSQILSGLDQDLCRPLIQSLRQESIELYLDADITDLKFSHQVTASYTYQNQEVEKIFDKVLVTVGRKPNSSGLGNIDLSLDKKGFIKVDEQLKTNYDHIFAIGDITHGPMLAHKATHQGLVAAEVVAGKKVRFQPLVIPNVVFTHPEIAWCGLTETEMKEKKISYKAIKFPWQANGRALTMSFSEKQSGLTKLLVHPDSGKILGAGIVGKDAGNLISELVLAIEMEAHVDDIRLSIHPHPTLSETIMESAEEFDGLGIHTISKKN